MANSRKYFKSKAMANKVAQERREKMYDSTISVFKMPKGTRHSNMYFVGSHLEFINKY